MGWSSKWVPTDHEIQKSDRDGVDFHWDANAPQQILKEAKDFPPKNQHTHGENEPNPAPPGMYKTL